VGDPVSLIVRSARTGVRVVFGCSRAGSVNVIEPLIRPPVVPEKWRPVPEKWSP